ncbi:MAG: 16S rRNA (guanine(527)-N(7))-methyltransferase RsmG [Fibromonadaceae bacterium]|jgi:16S rRNA (guanine527-N7)-methyltransferase|nr:16S rRNA (guanine(527)-N(7))-methyltransferase RsmG [Fibromonadaceae bacterium]
MQEQINLLLSFAKERGLELPEKFLDKIMEFCGLLLEANKNTNLISKNDEKKLLTRHVADSLVFAKSPTLHSHWADIGSGAGFPVVPLCLYFPHTKFFAIECRKKRCEFLNAIQQKLNLQNLEIIQGNVRTLTASLPPMDIVSCRAVGGLQEDFECAKKLLKKGGCFLTLKSKRIIDELKAKKDNSLKQAKIWDYRLPGENMEYALVCCAL